LELSRQVRAAALRALAQGSNVKPVLQALILAERIFEDKGGRKIICGTFNTLHLWPSRQHDNTVEQDNESEGLPTGVSGSPYAFISLTDVCNNTTLELQFASLKPNRVLLSNQLKIECHDRLATIELVVPLPHLIVPGPGVYTFDVIYDGEVLGSHRMVASNATEEDLSE
jgi:hypothetical protein